MRRLPSCRPDAACVAVLLMSPNGLGVTECSWCHRTLSSGHAWTAGAVGDAIGVTKVIARTGHHLCDRLVIFGLTAWPPPTLATRGLAMGRGLEAGGRAWVPWTWLDGSSASSPSTTSYSCRS